MAPVQIDNPFEAALLSVAQPLLTSLVVRAAYPSAYVFQQIGGLITWGLQGILCVQVYNYYLSFPKDPIYMKCLVHGSLLLELTQTILVTRDTYVVFASGYGNVFALDDLHLLWFTLPIMGGIVGLLCHLTFSYRISLLAESRVVGCVISAFALGTSIAAFTFGGKLFHAGSLSQTVLIKHIYLTCGMWNGLGAFCDVVIAGCMFYYLSRSQTGFKNTDLLITRIIRMTIETGFFTATASIASAVLFVGFRENLSTSVYFVIPAIVLTKLYSITIVATFNNRPNAVGGPPPLPASDNSFEDNKTYSRNFDRIPGDHIKIGRTVVQQVWKDDVPLSHIQTFGSHCDETLSIKDDGESQSSRKVPDLTTTVKQEPVKF